jgi:hypothetical protein
MQILQAKKFSVSTRDNANIKNGPEPPPSIRKHPYTLISFISLPEGEGTKVFLIVQVNNYNEMLILFPNSTT